VTISLTCHRDIHSGIRSINVEIEMSIDGRIWSRYLIDGPLRDIVIPDPALSNRATGLWTATCFELFARPLQSSCYAEFNFSPSSQWAAYRFAGYRDGAADLVLADPPEIGLDASEEHLALEANVTLPAEWRDCTLQIGLSAVIEETDGTKSYWALAHPLGKPDFHHPDCFALTLPAPGGA